MKICVATWLHEPSQGEALTKVGHRHRLLSYWHTRDREDQLDEYARTGRNEAKARQKKHPPQLSEKEASA